MRAGKIIAVIVLAGAAAAAWHWWPAGGKQEAAKPQSVAVRVATAERRDMPVTLTQVGNVLAYETVAVRARLDSQVAEVKFKDGDEVQKGALLFVLDDRALKAQEQELAASVTRDQAQLANLKKQYERTQAIAAQGYASNSTLDAAKAAYLAQQGTANATEASLGNVRVQLGYTRITAPISGRTGTINITTGNNVKANDTTPLVTINQVKPIRIHAALPQTVLASVKEAMAKGPVAVQATRDGEETASQGTLEYIENGIDTSTGTFAANAVMPNEDEALWPGMFVTLKLTLGEEKSALTVPEMAVQHGQSGDYIFTIADGKAHKHAVEVVRMQDGMAIIADGIGVGDSVVTDGFLMLKDGASVTVAADKKPAG